MDILNELRHVVEVESNAVRDFADQIDESFEEAVNTIFDCQGKVVVTGVGKSGHIGKKFAATLASTGTPAFFVHSTEGVHGDLGMIEKEDIVIMISNSGETGEVLSVLPTLNKIGVKKIAITSKENSTIAKNSDISMIYKYEREADENGLAPTTSSTLTLVLCDAVAVTVSKLKQFNKEKFHLYHPGGSLGKQLNNK